MLKILKKYRDSDFIYYFLRDPVAIVSFSILLLMAVAAILAPVLSPTNPYDLASIDIMDAEIPPIWLDDGYEPFVLGTDDQGRDILSIVLYGLRTSLLIAFGAVVLQFVIGTLVGLWAGYIGGKIDVILMRAADIQLSFSTMMVAIIVSVVLKAMFGSSFYSKYSILILILVIGIAEWPYYARVVRSSVLSEKKKEYVEAAQVMGLSRSKVLFSHIFPNVVAPALIVAAIQIANAVMSEAALSFLGLGMPPNKPSLGVLINIGFEHINSGNWWILLFPSIVLVALALFINLFGDWLQDVFNPKVRK